MRRSRGWWPGRRWWGKEALDLSKIQVPGVMGMAGLHGPLWLFGEIGVAGSRDGRLFDVACDGGLGDLPACPGEVLGDLGVAAETEPGEGLGETVDGIVVSADGWDGLHGRAHGFACRVGFGFPATDRPGGDAEEVSGLVLGEAGHGLEFEDAEPLDGGVVGPSSLWDLVEACAEEVDRLPEEMGEDLAGMDLGECGLKRLLAPPELPQTLSQGEAQQFLGLEEGPECEALGSGFPSTRRKSASMARLAGSAVVGMMGCGVGQASGVLDHFPIPVRFRLSHPAFSVSRPLATAAPARLLRSSRPVSVVLCIAEGGGRRSRPDKARFYTMARGSVAELRGHRGPALGAWRCIASPLPSRPLSSGSDRADADQAPSSAGRVIDEPLPEPAGLPVLAPELLGRVVPRAEPQPPGAAGRSRPDPGFSFSACCLWSHRLRVLFPVSLPWPAVSREVASDARAKPASYAAASRQEGPNGPIGLADGTRSRARRRRATGLSGAPARGASRPGPTSWAGPPPTTMT